ncbi:MAG: hydroxyethylthiazole kinase [Filifactoraceae bacterium]
MLRECLKNLRDTLPLIQNITNYVTVNDCANILLACGASPIMADGVNEVQEIQSICNSLNINIGTLNETTIKAMLLSGETANKLNHPIVLDPVGVGASIFRTNACNTLLKNIKFSVIRGNISEIRALALGEGSTKGVDANIADTITNDNLDLSIDFIKKFSARTSAIICVTGAIDIVANKDTAYVIRNGHPMMAKITGTGCMLSAMVAAYLAANPNNHLLATVSAVCAMGLSGELAYERLDTRDGNSTYRNFLIDEIYNLDGDTLESGGKYEIR